MRIVLTIIVTLMLIAAAPGCATLQAAPQSIATPTNLPSPPVIVAPTALPEPLGAHPVYVLDTRDGDLISQLLVIDADARKVVRSLGLRSTPDVAFSPDGTRLYVADSYRTQVVRGEPVDALSVYEPNSLQLLIDDVGIPKRLQYKLYPLGWRNLQLSPDGARLFIAKYGAPDIHALRVSVLDTRTFETVGEYLYPSCAKNHFWISQRGQLICVVGARVEFLNPSTRERESVLELPLAHETVATLLAPRRDRFYIFTARKQVRVVDLSGATPKLTADKIDLNLPSEFDLSRFGHIALSPDSSRLYVGLIPTAGENYGSGVAEQIWVFDTATWQRLAAIQLDIPAFHLAVSNDGQQLYTVNPRQKALTIYDARDFRQLGVVSLGVTPAQILIRPELQK